MSTDAQDWQRVVKTVGAAGAVPDAPDWQRVVVGPGGAPVGGGGQSEWALPADWGWIGWVYPVNLGIGSSSQLTGQIIGWLVKATQTKSCTGVSGLTVSPGSGFSNSYYGLYSLGVASPAVSGQWATSTLDLLAVTDAASTAAALSSAGLWQLPWVAPVDVVAGTYFYVVVLMNFTATPAMGSSNLGGGNNQLTGRPAFAWATPSSPTYTALPATLSPNADGFLYGIGDNLYMLY